MAENLSSLSVRAIDHFSDLVRCQQLIDLCLEEDGCSEKSQDRIGILLECYRCRMADHLSELDFVLREINLRLRKTP